MLFQIEIKKYWGQYFATSHENSVASSKIYTSENSLAMAENIGYEEIPNKNLCQAVEIVEEAFKFKRKEAEKVFVLLFLFTVYNIHMIKQIKKPKPCIILS